MSICSSRILQCLAASLIFVNVLINVDCQTINDTNRLLKDKLADYNRVTRPIINQSQAIVVNFTFDLTYIKEYDEVKQTLEVIGSFQLHWFDELMTWNPFHYGKIFTVLTESGQFWTPNLILLNNADKMERLGESWQTIRYAADGSVYYYPFVILTSTCSADVSLYPWDIHLCVMSFIPQGYTPAEMYLRPLGTKVISTNYMDNGIWRFIDSEIKPYYSEHFSYVGLYIAFERKPLYVIVNIIIPVLFMSFLNILVFLIPAESGERIGYSITVLLAIAVFLTIVGDTLPKTSTPMSYFSYLLITLLSASILIILCTIFNLRVYFSDESLPVTGCWLKLATCMRCGCIRNNRTQAKDKYKATTLGSDKTKHVGIKSFSDSLESGNPSRSRGVYLAERNGSHKDESRDLNVKVEASNTITWKSVSEALDKILIIFFFAVIIIATVTFSLVIANSDRQFSLNP